MLNLEDFNFYLPKGRIAEFPKRKREEARLLIISRKDKEIAKYDLLFKDIINFLSPQDMLVLNATKVIKAAILGRLNLIAPKEVAKPQLEILLIQPISEDKRIWKVRAKGKGKKYINDIEELTLKLEVAKPLKDIELKISKGSSKTSTEGYFILKFPHSIEDVFSFLEEYGKVPLPPYIKRAVEKEDEYYYQTVYAETYGSIAAPTAGLHFSQKLLKEIEEKGVYIYKLILHIGEATFIPPKEEELEAGKLQEEWYSIPLSLEKELNKKDKRIIACGTSTVRALESYALSGIREGKTDLFIYPGWEFKLVDKMITNFHLPRSSTYILTASFLGLDLIKKAYSEALDRDFYFGSYGDSMFII